MYTIDFFLVCINVSIQLFTIQLRVDPMCCLHFASIFRQREKIMRAIHSRFLYSLPHSRLRWVVRPE